MRVLAETGDRAVRHGGVDEPVVAGPALQRVAAAAAREHVVAGQAPQGVGIDVAGQGVGEARAHHLLDAGQRVALGVATRHRAGAEVDRHGGSRAGIAGRVDAGAAGDRVGPAVAFDRIVAVAAVDRVVAGAAIDAVMAGIAEDLVVLAAGIHAVVAGAAMDGVGPGPADEAIRAVAAVETVVAGLAGERVVAAIAHDRVVAQLAADDVADVAAGQLVGIARPVQVLDAGQRVALGVAAGAGAGQQVDRHRRRRTLIVGVVRAVAAVQDIGPGPAVEPVVAGGAGQRIGAAAAGQPVGEGRAVEILDRDEGVALGVAARAGPAGQVDLHGRGRGVVIDRVDAEVAIENISAAIAGERVIPVPARKEIVPEIAEQGVVEGRAGEILDPEIDVALGIVELALAGGQAGGHGARRAEIDDGVEVEAAIEGVGAAPAVECVVPFAAGQGVDAAVAGQGVEGGRADDVLDILVRVALGGTVEAQPAGQVHSHMAVGDAEIDRVVAVAAIDGVAAVAAGDPVVAGAAIDGIGPGIAQEEVGEGGPDQGLEADHGVADGFAAIGGAVQRQRHALGGVGEAERVEAGAAIHDIGAQAALDDVVAAQARERVVAVAAIDDVDAVGVGRVARIGPGEGVGAGGAVEGLGHGTSSCVSNRLRRLPGRPGCNAPALSGELAIGFNRRSASLVRSRSDKSMGPDCAPMDPDGPCR